MFLLLQDKGSFHTVWEAFVYIIWTGKCVELHDFGHQLFSCCIGVVKVCVRPQVVTGHLFNLFALSFTFILFRFTFIANKNTILLPFKVQWHQMVTFQSVQCHPGLTYIFNF